MTRRACMQALAAGVVTPFAAVKNGRNSSQRMETRFHYGFEQYPGQEWRVIRLSLAGADPSHPRAVARLTPDRGCNVFALQVDGVDYLMAATPDDPKLLGTPILYPTPNRVRDARFPFDGRTFAFAPNSGRNFIHGLVRNVPWDCDDPVVAGDRASVTARILATAGNTFHDQFPVENRLEVTITLLADGVRWDFTVQNRDATHRLPFGLAIHPYFPILGSREQVRIQVPAQKWMEATDLLPTGRLVDPAQGPADLRRPTSLAPLDLDDVFWGLDPAEPSVIYYDAIGKKVTLQTSDLFGYSVVYTPPARPFFCIENQSCSTDAHNLYARGLVNEAGLRTLEPGQSLSAWIAIAISDL